MKNGKVFQKLSQDKRVARLTIGEKSATVTLADNCYVEREGKASNYALVKNAHEARLFIQSAKTVPAAREGHHLVRNLMTGIPVEVANGTPGHCDPSQERYWSM